MILKDSLLSKYEKPHVNKVVIGGERLDQRSFDQYRQLDIKYGKKWGSCVVSLGETKVMANVTCEVQQPKATRPNEGLLFINVEINHMVIPNAEQSTISEMHTHLNRLLEKCIKESHCVDLEALCIVAEEKVWNIRVDVVVLNYEGNMIGCCSIAALAAIVHFRRPDVTIDGVEVVIHDPSEREPIPLSMHHYPVAVSYAIFDDGNMILSDPTEKEERAAQAELVLGMNAYRELCGMHLAGAALIGTHILIQCSQKAAKTAGVLVQAIKTAMEVDAKQRNQKKLSCLVASIDLDRQLPGSQSRSLLPIKSDDIAEHVQQIISSENKKDKKEVEDDNDVVVILSDDDDEEISVIQPSGLNSAEMFTKKRKDKLKKSPWNDDNEEEISLKKNKKRIVDEKKQEMPSSDEDEIALVREITSEDRIIERIELTGDSEEEDIIIQTNMEVGDGTNRDGQVKHEK